MILQCHGRRLSEHCQHGRLRTVCRDRHQQSLPDLGDRSRGCDVFSTDANRPEYSDYDFGDNMHTQVHRHRPARRHAQILGAGHHPGSARIRRRQRRRPGCVQWPNTAPHQRIQGRFHRRSKFPRPSTRTGYSQRKAKNDHNTRAGSRAQSLKSTTWPTPAAPRQPRKLQGTQH